MAFIPRDQVALAREMDLLTYLRRFEPQELVHNGGNVYSTRTHDSLKISNVAFAAHNRGVANHFGKIHTLSIGDKITYTTKLGTRTYEVYSVSKISVNDVSVLNDSADNILTLVTCVRNEPDYRWCVQARQKST